jgi:hypothetical protein
MMANSAEQQVFHGAVPGRVCREAGGGARPPSDPTICGSGTDQLVSGGSGRPDIGRQWDASATGRNALP